MTVVSAVIQRGSVSETFLIAQKEGCSCGCAPSNAAEVSQLVQLMLWWNYDGLTLVHITLHPPTTTVLWLGRVAALCH